MVCHGYSTEKQEHARRETGTTQERQGHARRECSNTDHGSKGNVCGRSKRSTTFTVVCHGHSIEDMGTHGVSSVPQAQYRGGKSTHGVSAGTLTIGQKELYADGRNDQLHSHIGVTDTP